MLNRVTLKKCKQVTLKGGIGKTTEMKKKRKREKTSYGHIIDLQ